MSSNPDYLKFKHDITEINDEKLNSLTTDIEFNRLGVELLKEIGTIIITVSSIYRTDKDNNKIPYSFEEAALIGNLVRYSKLCVAFTEQIAKNRSETSLILFRSLSETYVTLKYFLKFKDEHTLRHYIKNSLRQEKELLEIIKRNVATKEEMEPIEKRMTASISASFRDSDFEEDEINNSFKWDSKVKARIKEIIHPDFYVLMYGNASHAVHGNWQDLINFHLEKHEDGFLPDTDWTFPTLQIIHAATILSCDLLHNYAEVVLPESESKNKLLENIEDIIVQSFKLDMKHELFIQQDNK